MDDFIEYINKISLSVWDGLHISIIQLVLLFIGICFFSLWIFNKNAKPFITALAGTALFFALRSTDIIHHRLQQKIIVYNVPKQSAIDIFSSNTCLFAGDSTLLKDAFLKNFNLKPSRVKNRVYSTENTLLPNIENCILSINTSKVLVLGKAVFTHRPKEKIGLTILILSHNTIQTPVEINNLFKCDYIIADSSIPVWKSTKWKKEFEQLHLRFYSVAQDGAFTVNL
jgi:competence protein ComEC